MEQQERQQIAAIVHKMLAAMVQLKGSDLFLTAGFPPAIKLNGKLTKLNETALTADQTSKMARAIASEKQWQGYIDTKGQNFAISLEGIGRFRINIFTQQQRCGMVIRVITTEIPDFDKMNLPPVLKTIVQEKRGLILLVGGTGSGKSTTLAAMLGVRNRETHGHIITIEDPVEYVHPHGNCIVTHREVGIDTVGWFDALKDTLRQAPDVILIGEIRDAETMEAAIAFAETGHLCVSTLHANNADQALERIMNFFPPARAHEIRLQLSLNLRAIISQRLVASTTNSRAAALEVLLDTPRIKDLIKRGETDAIKDAMEQGQNEGCQTFDSALCDLVAARRVAPQIALAAADSPNNLRLRLQRMARQEKGQPSGNTGTVLKLVSATR